jgi:hypothetical protein
LEEPVSERVPVPKPDPETVPRPVPKAISKTVPKTVSTAFVNTHVQTDDDEIPPTTHNTRYDVDNAYNIFFCLNGNRYRFYLLLMGIGCLVISLLTLLIIFAVLRLLPHVRKPITTLGTKEG